MPSFEPSSEPSSSPSLNPSLQPTLSLGPSIVSVTENFSGTWSVTGPDGKFYRFWIKSLVSQSDEGKKIGEATAGNGQCRTLLLDNYNNGNSIRVRGIHKRATLVYSPDVQQVEWWVKSASAPNIPLNELTSTFCSASSSQPSSLPSLAPSESHSHQPSLSLGPSIVSITENFSGRWKVTGSDGKFYRFWINSPISQSDEGQKIGEATVGAGQCRTLLLDKYNNGNSIRVREASKGGSHWYILRMCNRWSGMRLMHRTYPSRSRQVDFAINKYKVNQEQHSVEEVLHTTL